MNVNPSRPPKIGSYESRVTKPAQGSGNQDLDSFAGNISGSKIKTSPKQTVSGKKGSPPAAAKTGGNPLSGSFLPKKPSQLPSSSKTKNAKGENRTTY